MTHYVLFFIFRGGLRLILFVGQWVREVEWNDWNALAIIDVIIDVGLVNVLGLLSGLRSPPAQIDDHHDDKCAANRHEDNDDFRDGLIRTNI